MKKNILILAGYYYPGVKGGGPIKSISNLVDKFSSDYNFYVVADDRDLGDEKPYEGIPTDRWIETKNSYIYYTNKEALNMRKIKQILNSIRIDILYLNSLFDLKLSIIPMIMKKLGVIDIKKVIVAPRGNLSPGALNQKKGKKNLLINFSKIVSLYNDVIWHATAELEKNDIINVFGNNDNIIIANNLTMDYKNMFFDKDISKKPGEIKIIFLSRIHPKKNLEFSLELLKLISGEVSFDIFGPIEDKDYWEKCKEIITTLPENITANYKGIVDSENIINTFRKYHIFLFPTLGENFGHVISEALISGCPVITSNQTPWNELEKERVGYAIELDDTKKFISTIQKFIDMDNENFLSYSCRAYNYAKVQSNNNETSINYRKLFS